MSTPLGYTALLGTRTPQDARGNLPALATLEVLPTNASNSPIAASAGGVGGGLETVAAVFNIANGVIESNAWVADITQTNPRNISYRFTFKDSSGKPILIWHNVQPQGPSLNLDTYVPVADAGPGVSVVAGIIWKGNYDPTVNYSSGNSVNYSDGNAYISLQDNNLGNDPSISGSWGILVNGSGTLVGSTIPKFTGSKLCIFGDSYSAFYGSYWIPQLLLKTGFASGYMDLQSGRQTANIFSHLAGGTDAQIIASLVTALAGSDAILIQLGTNDSGFTTSIGTPGSYGDGTYWGYLNRAIQLIQKARPDLMILWVASIQGSYNTLANLQLTNDTIKAACANYGIPFLNMLEESGINAQNLSALSSDGIHLFPDAYTNRWAPLLVDFILNKCAVGTSGTTSSGATAPFFSFPPIANHLSTDAPFSFTPATSNSTGAITYSVTGPATISGTTLSPTGSAGTVFVTATQAATTGFTAASSTQPFTITVPVASDTSFIAAHITDSALVATADGTLGTISGFYASNFIAVTPGSTYRMGKGDPAAASPTWGLAYYNSAKVFVSGVAGPFSDGQTFTIPTGTGIAYVRFSGYDAFVSVQTFDLTTVTVAPTIVFTAIPDKLTTDSAFTASVTSDSSGAITLGVTGPATVSGTTVTLTGSAGSVTVTATQAAATGFTTGSASRTFNVTFAPDTTFVAAHVTVNSLIQQTDGTVSTDGAFTAFYASNFITCTPGVAKTIAKGCSAANPVFGLAYYNSSRVFLTSGGSDPTSDGQTFTPPVGAAYLRFSGTQPTTGQSVT